MSFFQQVTRLFAVYYILGILFLLYFDFTFITLAKAVFYGLFYAGPFLYPLSFILIFIYSVGEEKLEKKGYQKWTAVLLTYVGLIIIVNLLIFTFLYFQFQPVDLRRSDSPFHRWVYFFLTTTIVLLIPSAMMRLYRPKVDKDLRDDYTGY